MGNNYLKDISVQEMYDIFRREYATGVAMHIPNTNCGMEKGLTKNEWELRGIVTLNGGDIEGISVRILVKGTPKLRQVIWKLGEGWNNTLKWVLRKNIGGRTIVTEDETCEELSEAFEITNTVENVPHLTLRIE